ncbi:MAG: RluA family pseudouridine synthase [Gammaproteobacteria bacterium]|nr:RluA family pseudouridine synthase [Gammaproteobacteria bacterium]
MPGTAANIAVMDTPSKQRLTEDHAGPAEGQAVQPVRTLTVDSESAGQRVDNFVSARCKGLPKSHVYRLLRTGQVRVNGGRVKPAHRLLLDDRVRLPPMRVKSDTGSGVAPGESMLRQLQQSILFEDSRILVLNKPAGLAVHGGSGLKTGVIEALRTLRPDLKSAELVHRLDRGTSGVLLLTKRRSALRALHEQFRAGRVEKRYLALGMGDMRASKQRVAEPLLKIERGGERMVVVDPAGQSAVSHFSANRHYAETTLLEVLLETGRTHQIRAHARHLGHPLAGDDKYGDQGFNSKMRKKGLHRMFLHAKSLSFVHPGDGQKMVLDAPLPAELKQLLNRLEAESFE